MGVCYFPHISVIETDGSGFPTACLSLGIDDEVEVPNYTQSSAPIQRVICFVWFEMSCHVADIKGLILYVEDRIIYS